MITALNRTAAAVKLAWRGIEVARSRGWYASVRRGVVKVARRLGRDWYDPYRDWIEDTAPSSAELAAQRRWSATVQDRPLITLVVRAEGRSVPDLSLTIRGLRRQTYPHWRAIVIGAGDHASRAGGRRERRLVIVDTAPSADVRPHLTGALRESRGDYVGVMQAGDTLSPEALYEFARAILGRAPRPDVLYCDEDSIGIGADARARRWPIFKPSWSPELLLGYHYTGRLTLARRGLIEEVGGLDPSLGVSSGWDLVLRLSTRTDRVARIAKCLYHNRCDVDIREVDRGCPHRRGVLEAHLRRLGLADAGVAEQANGTFRVVWPIADAPLVSVIVQTDCPERARGCIEFLRERTDYSNQEIILIDSGGIDLSNLACREDRFSPGQVRVVTLDAPLPIAEAWNAGAAVVRGQYLLFLDDDVEACSSDWLEELVRWAQRPGVAIVGTKLLAPNGVVSHGGLVLSGLVLGDALDGDAAVIFHDVPPEDDASGWGLFGPADTYRNYLAVSGACLLIPRPLYAECGAFNEAFLGAGHVAEWCLKAVRRGYRIAYTPYAALSLRGMRWSEDPGVNREGLRLIAQALHDGGLAEDPYWHPHLGPWPGPAALRPVSFPLTRDIVRRRVTAALTPDRSVPGHDALDDASLREALADLAPSFSLPAWTANAVGSDPHAAARFVLDLLRSDGELRRVFPHALSEGPDGDFCRWLGTEAVRRYSLPAAAPAMIRQAFEARPAAKIRQIYEVREGLTRAFPLAYLAEGRAPFFRWLVAHGRGEYGLTDEQILWFLLECDEEPARELVRTYRISPLWQRLFPDALTPLGWARFAAWLRARYGIEYEGLDYRPYSDLAPLDELKLVYTARPPWRRRFPQAFQAAKSTQALIAWIREHEEARGPGIDAWLRRIESDLHRGAIDRPGLNVLAHFCNPSGLGMVAHSVVDSLERVQIPRSLRDVPESIQADDPERSRYLDLEVFDVSLIHVQPSFHSYSRSKLSPRRDVYRIAMWYLEMSPAPVHWQRFAELVQEVWAPSRFIRDAVRAILDVPVFEMAPGHTLDEIAEINRADFAIPDGRFLFYFMFDMHSTIERKNPLGVIAAFRKAFRGDDKAALVIKVSRSRFNPDGMARLRRAAAEAGAIIIDQFLPHAEINGLLGACDCYVSLHRCEGLGLTMAEAMLLGKPVIATAYSGNLDFMDASNSLLVGHEIVEICNDISNSIYKRGYSWAEPSISEAARAMRWVYENREAARELGERARVTVAAYFSPEAAGRRMAQRLAQIRRERFGVGSGAI